jgi:integrase
MERQPNELPTYVTPEHFAGIYQACHKAQRPRGLPFPPADWWRALLVAAYMTGWRISDLLGLRRDDLDLETGMAISRAEDNKGRREERVKLHPVVVESLRRLACFGPNVFPWSHHRRTLDIEFPGSRRRASICLASGTMSIRRRVTSTGFTTCAGLSLQ